MSDRFLHSPRRRRLTTLLLAAPLAHADAAPAPAAADWPTRPVKLLVGFPGGSSPDMAARVLAEGLALAWGQPVVVDNRPGAAGNLAAAAVAQARDDHTLGVVINGNLGSARLLNPKLPFDPATDFSLLSLLAPEVPPRRCVCAWRPSGNCWAASSPAAASGRSSGVPGHRRVSPPCRRRPPCGSPAWTRPARRFRVRR